MSTYIFILGKDAALSSAELAACYSDSEPVLKTDSFVIQGMGHALSQQDFNRLGGQIKAGEVFAKVTKKQLVSQIADHLSAQHASGKLNYGLSVYGAPERALRSLLLDLKKEFKKRKVSSRFANQNFLNLSVAQHKGLKGKEIIVAKEGSDYYLAKVMATQDIDTYSKRDFKKPFRSMKVGMLPPKLAQIMINLAGSAGTIWDPFCGGGVLVMEGLLMGHAMLGSDINAKTLEGAQRNVDWTIREFNLEAKADLFVHDATKPVPAKKFDAVVCEGYLGPPQEKLRPRAAFEGLEKELTRLYLNFFKQLKQSGFNGPVVIGLPFFRTKNGELELTQVLSGAGKLGYKIDLNLKYARHDQLVGRQIIRFGLA